ncbi:cupin domain-containing protein [Bradyrhizobium sp. dw_411]|uniref:cupin domain-containing protein n=1 Tax=Bradyrhizobium sp. dw_411 TaxID=2720082 RepID=UPI001BCFCDEF|nr:cupin domain-containing protein [Bradyrhizobium sp. dw_411]
MAVLESLKKMAEKATGMARPSRSQVKELVRSRKANAFSFKDDGVIPNHPRWPLVLYRGAISLPGNLDPAAIIEDLFDENGWGDSWRNGIYDYVHYHSRIHEVLGIARGTGAVRFGGNNGRTIQLKAGDVAILPAGTGHQCLAASTDFLVVGAYPPSGTYDECTKSEDHARALKTIPRVGRPRKDPVYGTKGPLLSAWEALSSRRKTRRAG